jgi:cytoskeletal protein RodZ
VSLLDLVAVLILAGLLWWGAHAVAAVTHDATPAAPHAAPARH